MRPIVLLAAALLAGCNAPATTSDAPEREPILSFACAPAACGIVMTDHPLAEPWVAVDPADPLHAVAVGVGPYNRHGLQDLWLVALVTRDGGATWTAVDPPGGVADPTSALGGYNFAADVMVAFADDGGVLLASLVGRAALPYVPGAPFVGANALDLAVWRSEDGGDSYGGGQVVAQGRGAVLYDPTQSRPLGEWVDKDLLMVDPETGEVYLFWDMVGENRATIEFSKSADGGRTFGPAQTLGEGYGVSAAALGGTVLVTYRGSAQQQYVLQRSADAGAGWDEPLAIGAWPGPSTTFQPAPVALWREAGGLRAMVARAQGESGEKVVVSTSPDGGLTWSEPMDALPEVPSEKRNPALALTTQGRGVLAAYAGAPDGGLEMWAVPIAGGIVGNASRVASHLTDARVALEYFGAAATPTGAMIVWPALDEHGVSRLVAAALGPAGQA